MIVIASGADHEKISAANPEWTEYDWCRYWELDARKGYKRAGIPDPKNRRMDCGEGCKCNGIRSRGHDS
jgi:hypothetical protein